MGSQGPYNGPQRGPLLVKKIFKLKITPRPCLLRSFQLFESAALLLIFLKFICKASLEFSESLLAKMPKMTFYYCGKKVNFPLENFPDFWNFFQAFFAYIVISGNNDRTAYDCLSADGPLATATATVTSKATKARTPATAARAYPLDFLISRRRSDPTS